MNGKKSWYAQKEEKTKELHYILGIVGIRFFSLFLIEIKKLMQLIQSIKCHFIALYIHPGEYKRH